MNAHSATWKTYAPSPVWKGSVRSEVQFFPLTRRQASKIFHDIRRLERQTAHTLVDAFGRRSTQGKIGRMGILVAHTLIFDFLNYGSGRLDPSYQAIAHKACISVRSVARGLAKLKAAGVLTWLRRCTGELVDGIYQLSQDTNAYAINPPEQWPGFTTPPAPTPGDLGAPAPLYAGMTAGATEGGQGQWRACAAALEGAGEPLADALARLARSIGKNR